MLKKLESILRQADLSEEEIALYVLLLKKQQATANELITETGFSPITIYRKLRKLTEMELIKATPINGKESVYSPLSLSALMKKVAKEQRRLKKMELALHDLDPLLPYITDETMTDNELVEVRTGAEAFCEEYMRMPETCGEEYLHIGSIGNFWNIVNFDYDCPEEKWFVSTRKKNNVFARVLNTPERVADEMVELDSRDMRTTRVREDLPITDNYLSIGKNHIVHFLCDEEDPRVIIMRHPELVKIYNSQFKGLWQGAR